MMTIEKFWEKRSCMFGDSIAGVLIKSVPEAVNLHLHNWMLKQIESVIPKNYTGKILDLGCGYGRLSGPLLEKFPQTTAFGVDLSKTYVDLYNQNLNPRGKACKGNILKLPFENDYFDTVFMVTTLMYLLSIKDQEKAIREIFRVLKSGGNFVIIERNPLGYSIFTLGGIINKIRGKKHSEITAVSIDPGKLTRMIKNNGGRNETIYGIPVLTVFFPIALFLLKLSPEIGGFFLSLIKNIDNKINRFYFPSLYISYRGRKK